jgi:hypothetical protein
MMIYEPSSNIAVKIKVSCIYTASSLLYIKEISPVHEKDTHTVKGSGLDSDKGVGCTYSPFKPLVSY